MMMKKSLLLASLAGALFHVAEAQTFVSTTPENKNVVLEEFTGWSCQFCPDGHRRAKAFQQANPGDVVLINVHTGGYANPGSTGFDVRTSFGTALANQSGLTGYPAGTINRRVFQGNATALSRGAWATYGAQVLAENSPVNVATQATLDIVTRELIVDVEVYYTGNAANPTNKLNVALLQNGIIGPQIESGVGTHSDYVHNHVLRHLITGQWGDDIDTTTAGHFVSRQYVYTIPETIGSEPVDITQLEVAAFVAEGNQTILSGTVTEYITLTNFPFQLDAGVKDILTPAEICGTEVAPSFTFVNYGEQEITSLEITYDVNGGTPSTYTWTGSIRALQSGLVTLPEVTFSPEATNTVNVSITAVNGNTDENTGNDAGSTTFVPADYAGTLDVRVEIKTDNYGSETSWEIRDEDNNLIGSGGNYGNMQTYNTTVTLTEGKCYTFIAKDSYGDGMCCGEGNGSYGVYDMSGRPVAVGGQFSLEERTPFKSQNNVGITELNASQISLYPNPSNGLVTVDFGANTMEMANIQVVDALGKVVFTTTANAVSKTQIDLSHLANGLYNVVVFDGQSQLTKTINVQK